MAPGVPTLGFGGLRCLCVSAVAASEPCGPGLNLSIAPSCFWEAQACCSSVRGEGKTPWIPVCHTPGVSFWPCTVAWGEQDSAQLCPICSFYDKRPVRGRSAVTLAM